MATPHSYTAERTTLLLQSHWLLTEGHIESLSLIMMQSVMQSNISCVINQPIIIVSLLCLHGGFKAESIP